jgi:hypothetical protein
MTPPQTGSGISLTAGQRQGGDLCRTTYPCGDFHEEDMSPSLLPNLSNTYIGAVMPTNKNKQQRASGSTLVM